MNKELHDASRRTFIRNTAVTGAVLGAGQLGTVLAQDSHSYKVALIGCGGRGTGALKNHIEAAKHLGISMTVVATSDAYAEKAVSTGAAHGLPAGKCFGGYSSYKEVMKSDADIVIIATPPIFRPVHFEAAVQAGKHVFMEKPVAVDPPGARKIIEMGAIAKTKGLSVVAGTQRRHQASYLRCKAALDKGAIGDIRGGTVMWNQARLWYKDRNPGEDDASYMTRNWTSFTEMSGDHIAEQHVHNIDIANWFIGRYPVAAIGFGGRARRVTGNQFDFFSVDFDYGDGVHIHSSCRQVNGCYNRVGEFFAGSKGVMWGGGRWKADDGSKIEVPDFPEHGGPYTQEHVDLLNSIVKKEGLNEAETVASSTLCAIIGRMSAYTGQLVRWTDVTKNERSQFFNYTCSPSAADFETGKVVAPKDDVVAIPGK